MSNLGVGEPASDMAEVRCQMMPLEPFPQLFDLCSPMLTSPIGRLSPSSAGMTASLHSTCLEILAETAYLTHESQSYRADSHWLNLDYSPS